MTVIQKVKHLATRKVPLFQIPPEEQASLVNLIVKISLIVLMIVSTKTLLYKIEYIEL